MRRCPRRNWTAAKLTFRHKYNTAADGVSSSCLCACARGSLQMLARLKTSVHSYGQSHFGAFYSSAMGGIVTDPALMLLPIDDQFVSKGYGVAECVMLQDGFLYMLPQHMKRLEAACAQTGLQLPFTVPAMMRIVLDVAAASKKMNGARAQPCLESLGLQAHPPMHACMRMHACACMHAAPIAMHDLLLELECPVTEGGS